jgi:hypothetical protein
MFSKIVTSRTEPGQRQDIQEKGKSKSRDMTWGDSSLITAQGSVGSLR